jgi:hypothetical protein
MVDTRILLSVLLFVISLIKSDRWTILILFAVIAERAEIAKLVDAEITVTDASAGGQCRNRVVEPESQVSLPVMLCYSL